eukprot:g5116.t1
MKNRKEKFLPLQRVCLGTAQIGLDSYGIANSKGMLSPSEVSEMLSKALQLGITELDTARAYGTAESRIGDFPDRNKFTITTKVKNLDKSLSTDRLKVGLSVSVSKSLSMLKTERIDTVLLHSYQMYKLAFPQLQSVQNKIKTKVGKIGVSVYTPEEAIDCLSNPFVQHLQIPMNILDYRWREPKVVAAFAGRRKDVTVHARSIFLQGLIFLPAEKWPAFDDIDAEKVVSALCKIAKERSMLQLAIAYANSCSSWIDKFVIGCDSVQQLIELGDAFREAQLHPLTEEEIEAIHTTFNMENMMINEQLVSPNLWPK